MLLSDQEKTDQLPALPPKQEPISGGRGDVSWKDYSNQWNENHGTALMVFAVLILAIGSGLIYYQQNRFRPVAFPSSDAIQSVKTNMIESGMAELGAKSESTNSVQSDTIVVRVTGTADTKGKIRIAVYRSTENFNDSKKADWKGAFSIDPGTTTNCEIPSDAVSDRVAIAVFHDANNNSKLDRNALGIPTERFGYSNEARGKLGPPAFEEAVMDPPKNNGPIDLKIW